MEEGFAVNKPPMFKGANYDYWKEKMIAFESTHIDMWDVVEKGSHIPLDAQKNELCNDPPCRYDITTLNRENFNF